MKAFNLLLASVFMVFSLCTYAEQIPNAQKSSMDYALKTYIDAISSGKIKEFAEILDSEVKFTVTRGDKIINYTRYKMLNAMRATENVIQNCTTDYSIIEQSASQAIVKVIMKYEGFSRVNYVTMAQTNKGWRITNVSSMFI